MSGDLIALVVALSLGTVVIVLGLRRNLSETTRKGLPRFDGDAGRSTATLGLYEGGERRRRPLSSRQQRRQLAAFYLLVALVQAALAVLGSHEWLVHAGTAALAVIGAVVFVVRKSPRSSSETSA